MFEVEKDNRMTKTERLLYNIWQELAKINEVKEDVKIELKTDRLDIDNATRNELFAMAKPLKEKMPQGYAKLSTNELREAIRSVM